MKNRKKNKNILQGIQVQGLRLKEDDVLVIKHPVDEEGTMLNPYKVTIEYHKLISDGVACKVLSIPANIELLKIRKEDLNSINNEPVLNEANYE